MWKAEICFTGKVETEAGLAKFWQKTGINFGTEYFRHLIIGNLGTCFQVIWAAGLEVFLPLVVGKISTEIKHCISNIANTFQHKQLLKIT